MVARSRDRDKIEEVAMTLLGDQGKAGSRLQAVGWSERLDGMRGFYGLGSWISRQNKKNSRKPAVTSKGVEAYHTIDFLHI
jgi:hypothetical protein